jgi:hypothetical protein
VRRKAEAALRLGHHLPPTHPRPPFPLTPHPIPIQRNPWEGITLIPFIKESEMLDAITEHCPESALSPDERRRNAFGTEWVFVVDPTVSEHVASPLPGVYPDLPGCPVTQRPHRTRQLPVLTTADVAELLVRRSRPSASSSSSESDSLLGHDSEEELKRAQLELEERRLQEAPLTLKQPLRPC